MGKKVRIYLAGNRGTRRWKAKRKKLDWGSLVLGM